MDAKKESHTGHHSFVWGQRTLLQKTADEPITSSGCPDGLESFTILSLEDIQVSPAFQKFVLKPLCFYKRPRLASVLLTEGNPRRTFALMKKGKQQKSHPAYFAWTITGVACTPSSESCPAKPLPWELHPASQHQAQSCDLCLWAPGLYFSLLCASISKMCPMGTASYVSHFRLQLISQDHSTFREWKTPVHGCDV